MYKVLIVDDQKSSRELMRYVISDSEEFEIVGTLEDSSSAEDFCRVNHVDLIFMDIHTGGKGTGIQSAKKVKAYNVMLTVQWTKENPPVQSSFEISYIANGGTGYMDDDWGYYGESVKLAQNGFEAPQGKKFVAWAIGSVDGTRVLGGADYIFIEDPNNNSGVV